VQVSDSTIEPFIIWPNFFLFQNVFKITKQLSSWCLTMCLHCIKILFTETITIINPLLWREADNIFWWYGFLLCKYIRKYCDYSDLACISNQFLFPLLFLLIALQFDIKYSCAVPSRLTNFMLASCNVKKIMEVETRASCTFPLKFISVFFVRFEILTVMIMKSIIFWVVMLCYPVEVHLHFRGTYCLYLQSQRLSQSSKQLPWLTFHSWRWRQYFLWNVGELRQDYMKMVFSS
jgi:hypothetical protein